VARPDRLCDDYVFHAGKWRSPVRASGLGICVEVETPRQVSKTRRRRTMFFPLAADSSRESV
jgi:hypothetical protein